MIYLISFFTYYIYKIRVEGENMNKRKKMMKEIRGWIFSIFIALFIVVTINTEVFAKVIVEQSSMENTLYSGEQLILDKVTYKFKEPKRGDMIIFSENQSKSAHNKWVKEIINNIKYTFKVDENSDRLVKRIIGLPGDTIDIRDGYVYVNDEKLEEAYIKGETINREIRMPLKIGDNKLFVLGDNRPVSKDSRTFGLVDYNQVQGKVNFRVYPVNRIGKVH